MKMNCISSDVKLSISLFFLHWSEQMKLFFFLIYLFCNFITYLLYTYTTNMWYIDYWRVLSEMSFREPCIGWSDKYCLFSILELEIFSNCCTVRLYLPTDQNNVRHEQSLAVLGNSQSETSCHIIVSAPVIITS